nr:superoxide dismutase, Ni [Motilibacter deserti]
MRRAYGHCVILPGAASPSGGSVPNVSLFRAEGWVPVFARLLAPRTTVSAHCDLPCGVYDPAQARIEAESVKAICEKYQSNEDPVFRTRALIIKEQRSELVKHHLWVLWTDYFKPPHFEKYPHLHQLFNEATKLAGAAGGKGTVDPAEAQKLLDKIAEIDTIFWETKKAA